MVFKRKPQFLIFCAMEKFNCLNFAAKVPKYNLITQLHVLIIQDNFRFNLDNSKIRSKSFSSISYFIQFVFPSATSTASRKRSSENKPRDYEKPQCLVQVQSHDYQTRVFAYQFTNTSYTDHTDVNKFKATKLQIVQPSKKKKGICRFKP